ncbi:MAG: EamA family transporter [Candidatus Doudnabacteria bacterium]|nr:EamA family transporter [Candidatus Doudnabacteria bacterium]
MTWLFFALLAPLIWAITNIIDKFVLSKITDDYWIPAIFFSFAGLATGLTIFVFKGYEPVTPVVIFTALGAGSAYFFAELYYFKAAQKEEISRVISLVYLDPLFTAIFAAIFLKEFFSFTSYVGVACMTFGAFLISYNFESGWKNKNIAWLAVISAALFGASNILSDLFVTEQNAWTIFAFIRLGTFLSTLPWTLHKRQKILNFIRHRTQNSALIFLNSLMVVFGTLLFLFALSKGFATFTASLAALQPLFVLIIVWFLSQFFPHILKENLNKKTFLQKLVAAIILLVGAFLLHSQI